MKSLRSKNTCGAGVLTVSLLLAACNPSSTQESATAVYEDTIPCADCPGIIMNISFNTSGLSYERSMTYLEATADGKNTTFKESGEYTTEKGYQNDENALLYVLTSAGSNNEQVFLAAGDSAIILLDGNRELIRSGLNYSLRKKE